MNHNHAAISDRSALNAMAVSATLHCLTGCAIGEILGLMTGTALSWSAGATIALSVSLAFFFGYLLSTLPLLRAGFGFFAALSVVLAADTLSIAVMELVDNAVMAAVPGAMDAGLVNPIFWLSMTLALAAAFVAALPVNRYLLTKGKGHSLTMAVGEHEHRGYSETPDLGRAHQGDRGATSTALDPSPPAAPTTGAKEHIGTTSTLAAALVGLLLGGLTVSVAAQLDDPEGSSHMERSSQSQSPPGIDDVRGTMDTR